MQDTNDDTIDVQNEWSRFFENEVGQRSKRPSRRTLLRGGALATGLVLGGSTLAGKVAANRSNNFGNRNGIGAFLNEEAEWKDRPVWDSGVTDMTDQEGVVEIGVGAMTPLSITDEVWEEFTEGADYVPPKPDEGPFAFAPRVVEISPGTTVQWKYLGNSFLGDFPWPHDVVSLDGLFQSGFPMGPNLEYNFEETGNYLYYCTPHGGPEPFHGHYNLVGMRGAVIVSDD